MLKISVMKMEGIMTKNLVSWSISVHHKRYWRRIIAKKWYLCIRPLLVMSDGDALPAAWWAISPIHHYHQAGSVSSLFPSDLTDSLSCVSRVGSCPAWYWRGSVFVSRPGDRV